MYLFRRKKKEGKVEIYELYGKYSASLQIAANYETSRCEVDCQIKPSELSQVEPTLNVLASSASQIYIIDVC